MSTRSLPTPGWNLEYIMWVFTRVSGAAIALLAFIGFAAALVMGARSQMDLGTLMRWTFFPNPNHVVNSNIPDITQGWSNAFWQTMEMLIVFFGATHGFNGLRVVLEEYIHRPFWVTFWRLILGVLWLGTLVVAIFVILAS